MPIEIILTVLEIMVVVMLGGWVFGLLTNNGGWTDVFWTLGSGLALVIAALSSAAPLEHTPREWLVAAFVTVWAVRLSLYLAPRVASRPEEDPRYAALRERWGRLHPFVMLGVALSQAFATALLAVSVTLAAGRAEAALGLRDAIAVVIFVIAIGGETIADGQMKRFRADAANRAQVMDRGLWAWSRHPNYFFEWLGWLAYPVMALDFFQPITLLSATAPVAMYLLLRYVSGVPPLEAAMLRSRGDRFRDYQDRVSVFFPEQPTKIRSS